MGVKGTDSNAIVVIYHSHNTFVSGGSDHTLSIWDHLSKKRMKLYSKYPHEVSALSFSPDGEKLAIGVSYEHDNGMLGKGEEEIGKRGLMVKMTVMDDCRVSVANRSSSALFSSATELKGRDHSALLLTRDAFRSLTQPKSRPAA